MDGKIQLLMVVADLEGNISVIMSSDLASDGTPKLARVSFAP